LRVFDFDIKFPMAPTATGRDDFTPGSRISFGDLGFVASAEGELQLDPAATPVRVLTFGSLNFIIDRLGGILDYINDRSVELNLDTGDQVPTRLSTAAEQPASEGRTLPCAHDVAIGTYTSTYPPTASTFVGMAGYDSASIFDLLEDSAEDSSSDARDSDEALAHREHYMVNLANDISGGANGSANGGAPSTRARGGRAGRAGSPARSGKPPRRRPRRAAKSILRPGNPKHRRGGGDAAGYPRVE
jgi:hypothetical protein